MPKIYYAIMVLVYVFSTSMSHCDKAKGPLTTVYGRVSDSLTNEGYGNITLQITRQRGGFSGPRYKDFDEVVTDANGQYELTFVPEGVGEFSIYFKDFVFNQGLYSYGTPLKLKLGTANAVNFKVAKLVKLQVHLINRSTQNRNRFNLSSDVCCVAFYQSQKIIVDTVLNFKVLRKSKITLNSGFHNDYDAASNITFSQQFSIGNADTLINILNP